MASRGSYPWEDFSNAVVLKIEYMDDCTTRVGPAAQRSPRAARDCGILLLRGPMHRMLPL